MKAKTGSVASAINKRTKYVRHFAPSLTAARASLIPFEELFVHEHAGPQGPDDPHEEPYFVIQIEGLHGVDLVEFSVTAQSVRLAELMHDPEQPEKFIVMDEHEITMTRLYDYLRQLPRPPSYYAKKGVRQ